MQLNINANMITRGIILSMIAFMYACESPKSGEEQENALPEKGSVNVKIEPVIAQNDLLPILSSGVVASQEEMRLSFKIGGVIQSINVEEGQYVRRGQILARLDLSEINAQVAQAQSSLDKAVRDLERGQRLYEDTVVTLEQVQNLTTAKEVASANVKIARFNQQKSTIISPISGRVIQKMGERGEVVSPGSTILKVAGEKGAQVIKTGISEIDVVKLRINDQAKISFDAYPGEQFDAKVSEIAAAANGINGTYEVELLIDSKGAIIKNGFIGKIQLFPSAQASAIKIPISALVEANENRAMVYIPSKDGSVAERVYLTNYQIKGDHILIAPEEGAGITRIITEGAKYLRPGMAIQYKMPADTNVAYK